MASAPVFWIVAVALPMQVLMVDIFLAYLKSAFFPDHHDIMIERARQGICQPLQSEVGVGSTGGWLAGWLVGCLVWLAVWLAANKVRTTEYKQ